MEPVPKLWKNLTGFSYEQLVVKLVAKKKLFLTVYLVLPIYVYFNGFRKYLKFLPIFSTNLRTFQNM